MYANNTLVGSKTYTDAQESKIIEITGRTVNTEYTCYAIITDGAGNETITNVVKITPVPVYHWAKYNVKVDPPKYRYVGYKENYYLSRLGSNGWNSYLEEYDYWKRGTVEGDVLKLGGGPYPYKVDETYIEKGMYISDGKFVIEVNAIHYVQSFYNGYSHIEGVKISGNAYQLKTLSYKDDYIEDVTNTDRNAYPDDEIKSGYWYVFQGENKNDQDIDENVVGKPALTGFVPETTYYVTYDENGNENSTIPITEPAPNDWYDYEQQKWANIVVRNNGYESYFVWIPRYMYTLDSNTETVNAKFVDLSNNEIGTNTNLNKTEYKLPEAFTWGDDESNLAQLSGYWISKYKLRENCQSIPTSSKKSTSASSWIILIRQMEATGQVMGLTETIDTTTALATSESNNIDVHMQKNTEYGAMLLLGASQYGKQGSGSARYMSRGATTTAGTDVKATSTGNVYGIYELGYCNMMISDKSYEWTAAGGSLLLNGIAPKYINRYTTSESSARVGDAMVETKKWHGSDDATWLSVNSYAFYRGRIGAFSYYGNDDSFIFSCRAAVVVGDEF